MSIIVSPPTDNSIGFVSDTKSILTAISIEILSDYLAFRGSLKGFKML